MFRLIMLAVLLAASSICGAASVSYVIIDCTDPANPKEIASGTKSYSQSDIHVEERHSGEQLFWSKSLDLSSGYSIGATIYRNKQIDGFGLWAQSDKNSFSWEWFSKPNGDVFKKLQESGIVRASYRGAEGLQELASVTFESDVSLRLNQTDEVGKVTHRILVKKGSVLEFPP